MSDGESEGGIFGDIGESSIKKARKIKTENPRGPVLKTIFYSKSSEWAILVPKAMAQKVNGEWVYPKKYEKLVRSLMDGKYTGETIGNQKLIYL